MREFKYIILLALSSIFFSCTILGGETDKEITAGDIVFQTDQASYISHQVLDDPWPTYQFTLIAQYKNRSSQTIYLDRCYPDSPHPIFGVELFNEEISESSAYNAFWACVGHNKPITIKPGSIQTDTLEIRGPNSGSHDANVGDGVLEGRFRLIYHVQTCREVDGEGCALPDSLSMSNEFEVNLSD